MPGPYAPDDALIGPLLSAVKSIIQTEIPSIQAVYDATPSKGLKDNTVALEFKMGKVIPVTNGKMQIRGSFRARHVFRLTQLESVQLRAQSYIYPWLQLLSAWPNQHPTSYTVIITPTEIQMGQMADAGADVYGLVIMWDVVLEYNIPTS